jgi:GNAT superfamily N-acetyltransferase
VFDLFGELGSLHHDVQPEFFRKPENDGLFREFFDKALVSEEQFLIIGSLDDEPVGYIFFRKWMRPKDILLVGYSILYIHHLIIKEGHRYQGYGGAFIDYSKKTAKELGITRMGIDFWHFNEPARQCFSREGFEVLQHVMWLDL